MKPLLFQNIQGELNLQIVFGLPVSKQLVVQYGDVLPEVHQALQEHHLKRILYRFLLAELLI